MLVLTRKRNEKIIIDPRNCELNELGLIEICVLEIRTEGPAKKVRIGIQASEKVVIHREEIFTKIQRERITNAGE